MRFDKEIKEWTEIRDEAIKQADIKFDEMTPNLLEIAALCEVIILTLGEIKAIVEKSIMQFPNMHLSH